MYSDREFSIDVGNHSVIGVLLFDGGSDDRFTVRGGDGSFYESYGRLPDRLFPDGQYDVVSVLGIRDLCACK